MTSCWMEENAGSSARRFPGQRAGFSVRLGVHGAVPEQQPRCTLLRLRHSLLRPQPWGRGAGRRRGWTTAYRYPGTFRGGEPGNCRIAGVSAANLPSGSQTPRQCALGAVWTLCTFLWSHFIPACSSGARVLRRPGCPSGGRQGSGLAASLGGGWVHLLASHNVQQHPLRLRHKGHLFWNYFKTRSFERWFPQRPVNKSEIWRKHWGLTDLPTLN